MGEFTKVTGVFGKTAAELDRIAVEEAGRLYFTSQGYSCPVGLDVVPDAPEWGTLVIGTGGMGNCGTIVLRGLTPRTRRLLRQGKIALLLRHGVPEETARVAVSMPYGMEIDVALTAADAIGAVEAKGPFKGATHGAFNRWMGIKREDSPLSPTRKMAAAAIAAEVVQRRHPKAKHADKPIGSLGEKMLEAGIVPN